MLNICVLKCGFYKTGEYIEKEEIHYDVVELKLSYVNDRVQIPKREIGVTLDLFTDHIRYNLLSEGTISKKDIKAAKIKVKNAWIERLNRERNRIEEKLDMIV